MPYGITQSYFPGGFATGWYVPNFRAHDGSENDRTTHIWETDVCGQPTGACCGEETKLRSFNRQAVGVAIELVDCIQCLRDWPVVHEMILEERVKEWCFSATHPRGRYNHDNADLTIRRCV